MRNIRFSCIEKILANRETELNAIAEINEKGMDLEGEIKIDIDFEEPTL